MRDKRLLIISTLDSNQPFGAFTRPFYLGKYLSEYFQVYHLGLDCSAVDYASSKSIGSRNLITYIKEIRKCLNEFHPDIVYAHETLPGIAALITFSLVFKWRNKNNCSLIFDFHTFSAFEYWSRLSSVKNRIKEFAQFVKTYIAQGILILSGYPIITAGESINKQISRWYFNYNKQKTVFVGNGVAEDLLSNDDLTNYSDPYKELRPAKVIVVVAPNTFQFPSNKMSVDMAIEIAKCLEKHQYQVQFVIIGRNQDNVSHHIKKELPTNIKFTGFLQDRKDFIAHLKYADIGLLPFPKEAVAGGARNKALDYFASKNLVISTPEGLRGLEEFHHHKHLLMTGYSVDDISNIILEVALNFDNYQLLMETASQLVVDKYSWHFKSKEIHSFFASLN